MFFYRSFLILAFLNILLNATSTGQDVERGITKVGTNLKTNKNLNQNSEQIAFPKHNAEPQQVRNLNLLKDSSTNPLELKTEDILLVTNKDLSFELFVRHIPGRESILITESSAEPNGLADNYSLRSYNWHRTYGNEKRILNGKVFERNPPLYFLMDSNPDKIKGHKKETMWFHIHLPRAVLYGYPWGREGQFDIIEGAWINIRTFSKTLCDYLGSYKDNPFILRNKSQKKQKNPVKYPKEKPFIELTTLCKGRFIHAHNTANMFQFIDDILQENKGHDLDIVFILDTTISMKKAIHTIKEQLIRSLQFFGNNPENQEKIQRIGLVLYRDYPPDEYLTREQDFTTDLDQFQHNLSQVFTAGGRSTPEAVYEGIHAGIHKLNWNQKRRVIIQIGDDIPHQSPKKNISQQSVSHDALKENIKVHSILLSKKI